MACTPNAAVHKAAMSMKNDQIARVITSLMDEGVGETDAWPQNVKSVGSMFILQQPLKVPQDEGNAGGNSKGGDGGKKVPQDEGNAGGNSKGGKHEATDGAESTKQELAINVEFHKQLQLIVDECAMPEMSSTTITCLLLPSTNDLTKTQEQLKAAQPHPKTSRRTRIARDRHCSSCSRRLRRATQMRRRVRASTFTTRTSIRRPAPRSSRAASAASATPMSTRCSAHCPRPRAGSMPITTALAHALPLPARSPPAGGSALPP